MGILQTSASIVTSLLLGALTHVRRAAPAMRTHFLLAVSVLAVYWFQPLVPLRSFDFWFPSLTLFLVILTWSVISRQGMPSGERKPAWRLQQNLPALILLVGLPALIVLLRLILPDPIFTASPPPRFLPFGLFVTVAGAFVFAVASLARRLRGTLSVVIVLLISILIVLKTPVLSQGSSILIRTLTNRSVETASFTDLRWLGISYIAFRLIHTLRDRQLGRLPELSLAEFATYVIFFPALAAGPIDRAERFAQDLRKEFTLSQEEALWGGQRIVLGLFKKFVIADSLALLSLNDLLATQVRSSGWMWVIVYAYAFQIYFDFSGYTDIAIGIARLVGIRLPENFAAPYLKPNLTQFWNSWHMTLTQWFRSYFFNPLNRWMRSRKDLPAWTMILLGQVATMLLIGLWHGITLNFVLWSLWHGLGLFLQNRWSDFLRTRPDLLPQAPRLQSALQIGGIVLTFHFVALGWVFFALRDTALSWQVFRRLLGV
jgi:alginate O-acetyltransferase complex protein AlgI